MATFVTKIKYIMYNAQDYSFFFYNNVIPQALVSLKKYMPPPLSYFKVNICPFPFPHLASIFFTYL